MTHSGIDWAAIDRDPRFQMLHKKKTSFLLGMMVFSLIYYFLLPLGAAYFTDLFRQKIYGPVNFGLLFALSEFVVAWGLAFYYSVKAKEFDSMALELIRDVAKTGG